MRVEQFFAQCSGTAVTCDSESAGRQEEPKMKDTQQPQSLTLLQMNAQPPEGRGKEGTNLRLQGPVEKT